MANLYQGYNTQQDAITKYGDKTADRINGVNRTNQGEIQKARDAFGNMSGRLSGFSNDSAKRAAAARSKMMGSVAQPQSVPTSGPGAALAARTGAVNTVQLGTQADAMATGYGQSTALADMARQNGLDGQAITDAQRVMGIGYDSIGYGSVADQDKLNGELSVGEIQRQLAFGQRNVTAQKAIGDKTRADALIAQQREQQIAQQKAEALAQQQKYAELMEQLYRSQL
jgi:hypothetical protein